MGYWDWLFGNTGAPKGAQYESGTPASTPSTPEEYAEDFHKEYASQPGDPGYFDASWFLDRKNWEYMLTQLPGLNELGKSFQRGNYWADYEKNTGKRVRYPFLQYSSGNFVGAMSDAVNVTDWWR